MSFFSSFTLILKVHVSKFFEGIVLGLFMLLDTVIFYL